MSIALFAVGLLFYRRHYEWKGWLGLLLILVGPVGFAASVFWLSVAAKINSE